MLLQQNDGLGIFSLRGIKKQRELNCLAFVLFYFLLFNAPLKSYHVIHLSSKVNNLLSCPNIVVRSTRRRIFLLFFLSKFRQFFFGRYKTSHATSFIHASLSQQPPFVIAQFALQLCAIDLGGVLL